MKHTQIKKTVGLLLALLLTVQLAAPASAVGSDGESEVRLPSVYNADEASVDKIQEELRKIPAPILQVFDEQGWSLHVDRNYLENLSNRYGYTCIAATSYGLQRIYLLESGSVLHEFGHFLDWSMEFPEVIDHLFKKEAQGAGFLRAYAKSNRREYFADYFALWIRSRADLSKREEMRTNAPETYAYFETLEADGWSME